MIRAGKYHFDFSKSSIETAVDAHSPGYRAQQRCILLKINFAGLCPDEARRLSLSAFTGGDLCAPAIVCLQARGTLIKLAAVQFQVAR
jgi:hypothetical protein